MGRSLGFLNEPASSSAPLGSREWDSETYHRLSSPQVGWGRRVLSRLQLKGDETVLDAGCGTGRLTAELLDRLPHGRVFAVDLSQNMVLTARQHLQPRFSGQTAFVVADLQYLPYFQAMDGIFSTATFHWVKDHDRLFRSLYTALRPGGWLEAQCGGGPNLANLLGKATRLISVPPLDQFFVGWQSPWEYASPETTTERLRRAGFEEVSASMEPAPVRFDEPEKFRQYLATVIFHRHLDRISIHGLRERFLDELTQQSAKDDPPLVADYWRLNMSARRPV
jgi:ubiquinone/menaquinone biosynthesis C-methylase UbiE